MSFKSTITSPVYDERNADTLVQAIANPFTRFKGGFTTNPGPLRSTLTQFEDFNVPIIPRSEWRDRIEHKEKTKTRLSDIHSAAKVPILNQARNGYCWCFGMVGAYMTCRAAIGLPTVHLSAASLAAQIKGGRDQGGWAQEALEGLPKFGLYTDDFWPEESRSLGYLDKATEEQKRNAMKHAVPKAIKLANKNFDMLATCLLLNIPVTMGLMWWGHLVFGLDLVMMGANDFGVLFANSWDKNWDDDGKAVLRESKARCDEQIAMFDIAL